MSNPLIDKFYELHPDKKEEPKSQKFVCVSTPKGLKDTIIDTYTSAKNSKVSVQPSKLTSYDPHSVEGIFFETAEKIKNKDAKVIGVTYTHDRVGLFSAGMLTMTFQVQVWDTP